MRKPFDFERCITRLKGVEQEHRANAALGRRKQQFIRENRLNKDNFTWDVIIRIWWAFTWRSLLVGYVVALGAGVIVTFVFSLLGWELHTMAAALVGWICGSVVSVWAMYSVLAAPYSNFDINIVRANGRSG